MLSVVTRPIMLSVVMLSVVMLSVVAPYFDNLSTEYKSWFVLSYSVFSLLLKRGSLSERFIHSSPFRNNFRSVQGRRRIDDRHESEFNEPNQGFPDSVVVAHENVEVDARLGVARMRRRIPKRRFDSSSKVFGQIVAAMIRQPGPAEF
jgi:hypothetical protein